MGERNADEKLLGHVEAERRTFVKRLLGSAFAAPVLATFSIDALTARSAQAQAINSLPSTPEPSTLLLIGTGAVGLGVAAYRRSQAKTADSTGAADAPEPTKND